MDFHWHEVISFGRLVEKEPVVLAVELSVGTGSVGRAPLTHTPSAVAQGALLSGPFSQRPGEPPPVGTDIL